MPTRLCSEPRCPHPATTRGRCATHARTTDRQINRAGHAIYRTRRWQLLRRRVLFEQPLCPCGAIAVDVDHIRSLEQGGKPYERANLMGLCKACHGRKTKREQATR